MDNIVIFPLTEVVKLDFSEEKDIVTYKNTTLIIYKKEKSVDEIIMGVESIPKFSTILTALQKTIFKDFFPKSESKLEIQGSSEYRILCFNFWLRHYDPQPLLLPYHFFLSIEKKQLIISQEKIFSSQTFEIVFFRTHINEEYFSINSISFKKKGLFLPIRSINYILSVLFKIIL
jgi:hypothetical protein